MQNFLVHGMLKWNDFIDAGITHIKDNSFEVKPGFLPSSYIVDIILENNPDANVLKIKENYNILLQSIPTEWKKYVTEKEFKNDSFMAHLCVNYEIQNIVFSTCTVKIFYKLFIEKLFKYPVSNTFWSEKLN